MGKLGFPDTGDLEGKLTVTYIGQEAMNRREEDIGNGSGDAQGSERGLEYDTMSGRYAEFVETEVLPLVEAKAHVKLTRDPDGRATMGGSSGGSCALTWPGTTPSGTTACSPTPAPTSTSSGRTIPNSARRLGVPRAPDPREPRANPYASGWKWATAIS